MAEQIRGRAGDRVRVRVVVTGIGLVSPVGNDREAAWQALRSGRSGIAPVKRFDASALETRFAGEVREFDPTVAMGRKEARRADRYTQLAVAAAREALAQSGLPVTDGNADRVGAIVGSGMGGIATLEEGMTALLQHGPSRISPFFMPMFLPNMASGVVAMTFGLKGPNVATVSACATSGHAIGEAAETIRRGAADAMVAAGTEAAVTSLSIAGFNAMGALSKRNDDPARASRPFDLGRDGFVIAEGAAALVLESLAHAQARGATILGEVAGYGSTNDANHYTQPAPGGAGAAKAMLAALADAGLTAANIDYVNAHGTSTPVNERFETQSLKSVFGERAYAVPISSTKSMTGHLLGAAGALEASIALLAIRDGVIPPTINQETPDPECDLDYVPNVARAATLRHVMSNSMGFGGHNASLILSRWERA
jgi:3-oxoacyl-[acyl-carrier-protein] synthase II